MPNSPTARVAGNVRAELARAGLSQTEFAASLGKSQAWISRRLTGSTPFDVDDLVRIAGALGVSVATLTAGIGEQVGAA
jgi:transcriptional regulator with XRE-family HTH domain